MACRGTELSQACVLKETQIPKRSLGELRASSFEELAASAIQTKGRGGLAWHGLGAANHVFVATRLSAAGEPAANVARGTGR